MSQSPSKFAAGVPKSSTFGDPKPIEVGMALRGKNQIRIQVEVHSIAYTPPPLALNAAPALLGWLAATVQPVNPPPAPQSEVIKVPVSSAPATVQASVVCNAIRSFCSLLTYSMMSISPVVGQSPLPSIHNAGQTPHVLDGMCARSRMKRP